ncbi:hypothetical protein AB0B78_21805 [Streptomyces sp. NPDC040724]|uniref:hypothetical protein n=1 Tax=Streptomyces sp. NPDC040724 TaxID=3155612 RepID=UPI0033D1866D
MSNIQRTTMGTGMRSGLGTAMRTAMRTAMGTAMRSGTAMCSVTIPDIVAGTGTGTPAEPRR